MSKDLLTRATPCAPGNARRCHLEPERCSQTTTDGHPWTQIQRRSAGAGFGFRLHCLVNGIQTAAAIRVHPCPFVVELNGSGSRDAVAIRAGTSPAPTSMVVGTCLVLAPHRSRRGLPSAWRSTADHRALCPPRLKEPRVLTTDTGAPRRTPISLCLCG